MRPTGLGCDRRSDKKERKHATILYLYVLAFQDAYQEMWLVKNGTDQNGQHEHDERLDGGSLQLKPAKLPPPEPEPDSAKKKERRMFHRHTPVILHLQGTGRGDRGEGGGLLLVAHC